MDKLFKGVPPEIIVDDFLTHDKDQTDADQKLTGVLDRSRGVGLKFKQSKTSGS